MRFIRQTAAGLVRMRKIDLLIDRADNVMNLCEMKFNNAPYTIDKNYYLKLKKNIRTQKRYEYQENVVITLVTTYGVNENEYSKELVQNSLD